QELFAQALQQETNNHWWFGGGHLYEVFVQPIYFGPATDNRVTGALGVGYEVNDQLLREFSRTAGSEVVFWYGDNVARSTISEQHQQALLKTFGRSGPASHSGTEVELGTERFLSSSIEVAPGTTPAVRLEILKSLDEATAFLKQLNRALLALGLVAILGGSVLVFGISHTITRPLANLVSGVRALGTGDYGYPVQAGAGGDEVQQLTQAFSRMRESLQKSQRELLEAERLATIGRMASSISHDLRHSLAAVVANAEFLSEAKLDSHQREDLYKEVRIAVDQMTEMLSLYWSSLAPVHHYAPLTAVCGRRWNEPSIRCKRNPTSPISHSGSTTKNQARHGSTSHVWSAPFRISS